jgi:hypothetical protein
MNPISTANSSATNAVASLLRNAASSAATDAGAPAAKATATDPVASSAGRDPVDTVDLSDRAKATLARAKTERFVAGKLAAQVAATNSPGGKDKTTKSTFDDGAKLFEQLTRRPQSQQSDSSPQSADDFIQATFAELTKAAKRPDGSYDSYYKQVSDVFTPTSTPQQIDDWYNTNGKMFVDSAQSFPNDYKNSLAQAIQSRQLTFQSAADVPGLNLHNTYTFQGGEGGGGNTASYTYNQSADIFQDPTTNYMVSGDGTIISWAKTSASGTAPSA